MKVGIAQKGVVMKEIKPNKPPTGTKTKDGTNKNMYRIPRT